MASTRPQIALKPPQYNKDLSPALQKFMNRQNEVLGGKAAQDSSLEEVKSSLKKPPDVDDKGTRKGLRTFGEKEENSASAVPLIKPAAIKPPVGAVKPSEVRRASQISVPKIFQQDSPDAADPPENRRGSQVSVPKLFQQDSHNATGVSKPNTFSDTNEDIKPKLTVKPGAAQPRPPPLGRKPLTSNTDSPEHEGTTTPNFQKKPSDIKSHEKPQLSLQETSRVKLPSMDQQISLKNTSSSLSSTSDPTPPSEPKVTDFRSMLKPTTNHTGNQFAGKNKPQVFTPVTPTFKRVAGTGLANGSGVPVPNGSPLHELKRQNDGNIVERKTDSKQFKKVRLEASFLSPTPPQKPALPSSVDLSQIRQQYQKAVKNFNTASESEEDGGIYDDGTSTVDSVAMRSGSSRQSERISMIPDMTAEEEEEGQTYDDGCTPALPVQLHTTETDDMYVDAETERKVIEEDFEQLYECEESFTLSAEQLEEERKRLQKEEAEAKKKEEKEKREREKEEEKKRKKEEKDRAKREKEEAQLRKKFHLTGEETNVGEGIIKQDVKGGLLGGLSLKAGQVVTIVRLDNNPPNKWLIKTETNMGYADSSVIEVDPAIIRSAMANLAKGSNQRKEDDDDGDELLYSDVAQEDSVSEVHDDGEIYEEI